jgi:hypothetical protein
MKNAFYYAGIAVLGLSIVLWQVVHTVFQEMELGLGVVVAAILCSAGGIIGALDRTREDHGFLLRRIAGIPSTWACQMCGKANTLEDLACKGCGTKIT